MFASKAGAYQSGARKYWTVVEVDGSGKHSSLLRYGNNYCRKKFNGTVSPSLQLASQLAIKIK
jgi:hypothetical protein